MARDRGAVVVWIGSTLLVLGLVMVFFFPHRRVWVRIRTSPGGGSHILCAATTLSMPINAEIQRATALLAQPQTTPAKQIHEPGEQLRLHEHASRGPSSGTR